MGQTNWLDKSTRAIPDSGYAVPRLRYRGSSRAKRYVCCLRRQAESVLQGPATPEVIPANGVIGALIQSASGKS
jgi:hypothetical protein